MTVDELVRRLFVHGPKKQVRVAVDDSSFAIDGIDDESSVGCLIIVINNDDAEVYP